MLNTRISVQLINPTQKTSLTLVGNLLLLPLPIPYNNGTMKSTTRSFIGSDDGRAYSHARGTEGYDKWRVPAPEGAEKLTKAEFKRLYGSKQKRRFAKYNTRPFPAHAYDQKRDALLLFPPDCYKPPKYRLQVAGVDRQRNRVRVVLENEAYDDVVARLENVALAGQTIPETFTEQDLSTLYVPSRQVLAFAYATILPHVRSNFSKATRIAMIPYAVTQGEIYKKPEHMYFLSQFWRERIAARSGILMLYGEQHAEFGNAQMARLLGEMTRDLQPQGTTKEEHSHQHLHLSMPYDDTGRNGKTIDAGQPTKLLPPSADYRSLKGEPR